MWRQRELASDIGTLAYILATSDKCNYTFAGYNKQSMQLDATVVSYAYFNFYLGQLYSNIVEEAATSAKQDYSSPEKSIRQ
jgi:hypothetical protein